MSTARACCTLTNSLFKKFFFFFFVRMASFILFMYAVMHVLYIFFCTSRHFQSVILYIIRLVKLFSQLSSNYVMTLTAQREKPFHFHELCSSVLTWYCMCYTDKVSSAVVVCQINVSHWGDHSIIFPLQCLTKKSANFSPRGANWRGWGTISFFPFSWLWLIQCIHPVLTCDMEWVWVELSVEFL